MPRAETPLRLWYVISREPSRSQQRRNQRLRQPWRGPTAGQRLAISDTKRSVSTMRNEVGHTHLLMTRTTYGLRRKRAEQRQLAALGGLGAVVWWALAVSAEFAGLHFLPIVAVMVAVLLTVRAVYHLDAARDAERELHARGRKP